MKIVKCQDFYILPILLIYADNDLNIDVNIKN